MKKLTIERLSAYFPYGIKAKFKKINNPKCRSYVREIANNCTITCYDTVNSYPDKFKLLLRPLSWLTDEVLSDINCDLLDQIEIAKIRDRHQGYWDASYDVVKILLKNHVDIFGLIEYGFAEGIKD